MSSKYFKKEEYECRCGCGKDEIDEEFLSMLDNAREAAGTPFVVSSGVRCRAHNKKVGGKKDSAHVHGKAVDISAPDSRTKFKIIYGLINADFTRIGIGKDFIHADTDHNKDAEVLWLY